MHEKTIRISLENEIKPFMLIKQYNCVSKNNSCNLVEKN